jgi:hypothetical protein
MNMEFLLPILPIMLIARSLSLPFAPKTPVTEVVFRSPRDMNLQAQDVPDQSVDVC